MAWIQSLARELPYAVGAAEKEKKKKEPIYFFIFYFFCIFAISWAAPAAYGGSQARGPLGAVAAGLHHSHRHSNARSEPRL